MTYQVAHRVQVDTLERAQEGVCDEDRLGLADLIGKGELAEEGQGLKGQRADLGQLGKDQVRQSRQIGQFEVSSNLLEVVGTQGC